MTAARRPTMIETEKDGVLPFQTWFVRHRAEPRVTKVRFEGSPAPAAGVLDAIARAEVVLIGPSNPYVSIDPILTLPGVREAIAAKAVVLVSPIVHGAAIKGPLARMIGDLAGEDATPHAIARHYARAGTKVRGIVVEHGDEGGAYEVPVRGASTIMKTRADSAKLAREVLSFAAEVA
jgi:LPPG:FO 2-phospho-L-lactate transferase